ncbi:MAG TPA: ABC transporter ATP-binding protein [Phycisphaerae bacterium]|nr:ABC transporter ATP-binding protein [Phycisphaerae bacterium]
MAELLENELRRISDIEFHSNHPMKTLWILFRGQRRRLAVAVVAFVIKQSPVWVMPIVIGNVINATMAGGPSLKYDVLLNSVVLTVLLLLNIPLHTLYSYLLSKSVREVQLHMRAALLMRLQQFSMSYFVRFNSGRLQSKILRDVEVIQTLSRAAYDTGLSSLCSVVATAVVIITKRQYGVLAFFLLATPLAVMLTRGFRRKMARRNEEFRTGIESVSAQISEMVEMLPVTRAHALEEKESMRVRDKLEGTRIAGTRLDTLNELFGACSWVSFNLFTFACFIFTIVLVLFHKMPIGDVVMYQALFTTVIGTISTMTLLYPQLSTGMESLRSIGEILELTEIEEYNARTPVKSVEGGFKFENVSYRYPETDRLAIDHLSLEVRPGECVAVVGESGSGKSTLMGLIIGFHHPTEGSLLLDGHDMKTLNLRQYRRSLAVVPQQIQLFSGTIRENITYGLDEVSEEAFQQVLDTANVREFIAQLPRGVETTIGPSGATLSGGQRQRVAIARALIRNPKVIILDEATSGLDVISEQLVQEAISRLVRGRTTFIVAHRLSTIRHADKVVVLDHGRLIEYGPQQELLQKNGAFSRLKILQI